MHMIQRGTIGLILLLALVAPPAAGQWHDAAIGYGGGFASFGEFAEGDADLSLDAGWIASAQAEQWSGSRRVGLRLNGAFTQRPLAVGETSRDIETWMLDADLMLRLLPASEGRSFAPFLAVGGGMINYGLGTGAPIAVGDSAFYSGDNERQWMVMGGFGFDILPGGFSLFGTPIGFRLEGSDHVALESPFEDAEAEAFGPVHNFRVTLSMLGLLDFDF